MTENCAPVVVFDGVCLLCSRWVAFLLAHDRDGCLRFAAMQGRTGRALLLQHGLDPDDPTSFLLVTDGRGYRNSDAILRLVAGFGGAWRLLALVRAVPAPLRDAGYRLIARNRYRWFGRAAQCLVPDAASAQRFLD
ncbi:thiol-disulfide oxidoreductase DCC family protein [Tahibacter caeni]|uniref:thiol-disulfide oxidoreductase DCC family protein n=1 Tax=Tahibacter caeni TaxID=1453545 RepID=UPI0021492E79|nr:thiol-disulfide oxidoreductase DCC family protein [Tahibacter caeni]